MVQIVVCVSKGVNKGSGKSTSDEAWDFFDGKSNELASPLVLEDAETVDRMPSSLVVVSLLR